jgi:hypothetical protein
MKADLVNPRNFQSVGTVTLTEDGDRTQVQLVIRGATAAAPAIRAGACPELRPREYKLNPVQNGRSTTELDAKTKVGVILYAIAPGPEPVTLRQGGCTGQMQEELTPMRANESVSTVDAPLSEVADGNHSIVVGRSCGPSLKPF